MSTEEILIFYDILFYIFGWFHNKECFIFYLFSIFLHYKPSKINLEHICISWRTEDVYIYNGWTESDLQKKSNITSKGVIV